MSHWINRSSMQLLVLLGVLTYWVDFQWWLGRFPMASVGVAAIVMVSVLLVGAGQPLTFDRHAAAILILFALPQVLALVLIPFHMDETTMPGWGRYAGSLGLWGRVLNLVAMLWLTAFAWSAMRLRGPSLARAVITAYAAVMAVVLLVGLWQWLSFQFDVPFPALTVRSKIHGVSEDVRQVVPWRVTSIFGEPSYLTAFSWDFVILVLVFARGWVVKGALLTLAGFVLLHSYSLSSLVSFAAVAAAGLVAAAAALTRERGIPWQKLSAAMAAFAAAVAALYLWAPAVAVKLVPFADRITRITGRLARETRVLDSLAAIEGSANSGFAAIVFGHGPGSYALLTHIERGGFQRTLPETSNNMFMDQLFETGVFGFLATVALFVLLYALCFRRALGDRASTWLPLLPAALFASALYRTDFATPRFWVLVLIMLAGVRYGVPALSFPGFRVRIMTARPATAEAVPPGPDRSGLPSAT